VSFWEGLTDPSLDPMKKKGKKNSTGLPKANFSSQILLLRLIFKKIILILSPKYKFFHLKNHLLELLAMG
jgi:hypothetical protein